MGKLIEGLWDCPYCDTKGIGGSKRDCPNCGKARGDGIKFYMPGTIKYVEPEKAKEINRNPDWMCPYCNSLNSDSLTVCSSCGSERTSENLDYFSALKEYEEKEEKSEYNDENSFDDAQEETDLFENKDYKKDNFQNTDNLTSIKNFFSNFFMKHGTTFIIAFFAILLTSGLIYLLIPKAQEITIDNFSWERSIDIENYQTVDESGWSLPAGARLHYSQEEISGYEDVLDHYETRSRQVAKERLTGYETVVTGYRDLGNGYFEEITDSRPVYETYYETEYYDEPIYRQEPIYQTKYYYEIDKWLYDRSLTTSGSDKNPKWAEVPELPDNERVSDKKEKYYIKGINQKGKEKKISLSYNDWNKLEKGQKVKLKVSALGTGEIIE